INSLCRAPCVKKCGKIATEGFPKLASFFPSAELDFPRRLRMQVGQSIQQRERNINILFARPHGLTLIANQRLPWIKPAKPLVQLLSAFQIRRFRCLLVKLVQSTPYAANKLGGFPELKLELVDLLCQLFQNRPCEPFTFAGQTDLS